MRKLILLLSTLFILRISNVVAQVNVRDSLALVDLYDSAGGDNWTYKWYFYNPVIYWGGVHVTGNRVTSIDLRHNNLVGTIPSSISNMSNLDSLTLSENYLTGNIPTSVGQLNKLTMLDLDYNQLSGSVPSSLGQLANLQYLQLYSNQLSDTIPYSIGQLTNLIELELNGNQLTGTLPASLSNLSNLRILHLSGNKLSGTIPASLDQLTNLEQLYLSLNQFSGNIPPSLGRLSNLQKLVLGNNQLTGSIPSELGQLSNLTDLELDYNQLWGPVPSSLTHFSKFEQMYLFFNRFNFDGMEAMVTAYPNAFAYSPQANIVLNDSKGKFSVTAGGTLSDNTYHWYRNNSLFETITGDSTFTVTSPGTYSVGVSNSIVTKSQYSYSNLVLYSDTIIVSDTAILSDTPHIKYANREYTDKSGWTHYYFDNNTPNNYEDDTLLLSLNKHGQNIGSIGDGTFSVRLEATAEAGSGTGIKLTNSLITNPVGFLIMNRYWQVTPTFQPSKDVGVRFYYNNRDLNDVNGSYPTHDLIDSQLIFYKSVGGNPDPTTNLVGATAIISIMPSTYASDTTWAYHQLTDSTQYAEFAVASFSGGGGGGADNQAQPPSISSFTPTSGSIGTQVTIIGKNFGGTTSVSFGGTNASSFTVTSDSTITAVVGNGANGNVKIETPVGKDSLSLFTFTCDSVSDAKPTITSMGDSVLVSSNASYYSWYFNNKKLENETSHLLNITKAGFYHVETSSNNICWTASFDYVVLKNPNPLNDTLKMSVYPNPSQGNFTIDIKLPQTTTVTTYTAIYDVNGNKVLQTNKLIFFGNEIKVPVTLTTKGTFFIKVFVNGDSRQQTVIIQ